MNRETLGRVSSFQSLGTLDGPGVRFIVFLQGCPLRCVCCHNPETWDAGKGDSYSAEQVFDKMIKFKEYFGSLGGITLSGGEPTLQAEFASRIFSLCRQNGINTCLDTSGCIMNDEVRRLIKLTDYCLLDIKYTLDEDYLKYVGCSIEKPLMFLSELERAGVRTRLRQVIISGLNDDEQNISRLKAIADKFSCVEEIELLPFRKLCAEKYQKLGIDFLLSNTPETPKEKIDELNRLIK